MSINYPTTLDELTNPIWTDEVAVVDHAEQHSNVNDSIEALEAKVGIDSSVDTDSLDYKISILAPLASPTFTGTVTAPLVDIPVINEEPTDLKISTPSKGGVLRAIDKATGDTPITANGWIEDEKYGVAFRRDATAASAEFDSAVTRTGKFTVKFSTTDATGKGSLSNIIVSSPAIMSQMKAIIPLKPNTKYKFSCFVKTYNVAADSVYLRFYQLSVDGGSGTNQDSVKLTGTNDWTELSITFTTGADEVKGLWYINNAVAGNISDMWADINSMTLEEVVEDTSYTGKTIEPARQILQAITSTDSIDQSLDTGGAYANTYALTTAIDEGATHRQTFTPTKKYTTKIGVWIVTKGSGNWILVVHDSSNNVIASKTITNASLTDGAFNYFDVPNIWASGALHFHVYSSVADGTLKSNTSNDLETASYIQNYAKKSENFTVISNGIKTDLKADKDGLLSNSIIDLDNGKYRYDGAITTLANALSFVGSIYNYILDGGRTALVTATDFISNGYLWNGGWLSAAAAVANCGFVWKVNTILPIKHLILSIGVRNNETSNVFQISFDNINWTTLQSIPGLSSAIVTYKIDTDLINGLSTFYARLFRGASSTEFRLVSFAVEADIDTSSTPQGLIYPLAINQFTETVLLPSVATRAYYREAKFTNEYGVVMPAIEYTDASGVYIGYTPLKLDNSQEASPCISILSTTTNYQQTGTGSAVTDGYVLNDGEYMTLSTAVDEIKIDYQVGTGTTAITAITKNILYLSSDGDSDDATQDPSHQQQVTVGVREQGLIQSLGDTKNAIEDTKKGLADTKTLVQSGVLNFGSDAGTTDDYAVSIQGITEYKEGMIINFKANTVNTGASTLNVNSLGAKTIVKSVSTALANADIVALMFCSCIYDGTNFVLLNPRVL